MDVNEVLLRIVRGHWRLLVLCLVLPPLVVGVLVVRAHPTYTSSVRLQGGTVLPGSDTEADALLNLVKGVATSEGVVQKALGDAHVHSEKAVTVAKNVDVTRLGSSTVDDLTVTGPDRATTAAVAGALATEVVTYLNNAGDARTQNLLDGLSDRQKQLFDQRQQVASQLALTKDPVTVANMTAELSGIDQQLADINSTIRQLQLTGTSAAGSSGAAGIVSPAVSAAATPRNLPAEMGLAAVAGLVLGLLLATLAETLRPRVAGGRSFAREIDAPLIGRLRVRSRSARRARSERRRAQLPDAGDDVDPELLLALRAAAARAGVDRVLLTGPAAPADLAAAAGRLTRALGPDLEARRSSNGHPLPQHAADLGDRPTSAERNGSAEGAARAGAAVMTALPATTYRPVPVPAPLSVLPLHEYHPGQHDRAGLLPVVPRFAPYGSVRWLEDFARATGWPVLGALALDGRSRRRSRSGREREVAA